VIDALEGSITAMSDGLGERVFSMGFAGGVLTASLLGTSSSITPQIYEGDGAALTLTVLPENDRVRYLWFIAGALAGDDLVPYEPVQVAPGGLTVIGGDGGIFGVLDELGVYYRLTSEGAEVDAEVFAKAMERIYGADLVYAEGFDGTVLPDEITFSAGEETYALDGGSLFLPAHTGIGVSFIPADFESLAIEISLARGDHETAEAQGSEPPLPAALVIKDASDHTPLFELGGPSMFFEDDLLFLTVLATEGGTAVMNGGVSYPVEWTENEIELYIENRGDNGTLEIKSILVFKNRIQSNAEPSR